MRYISTNGSTPSVSFREAVLLGQAPDKGLFVPEGIPVFPDVFFRELPNLSWAEIAFKVARPYTENDLPDDTLWSIITDALNFNIPLIHLHDQCHILELFHGPTLAFKDVGARFMARCLAYFTAKQGEKITILVATSGDTGSAVANGFLGVEGVDVVILYPKGKVSELQEKQFTTLGENITALEIDGTFDDCQRMVKSAFADDYLCSRINISSANSINIARLLPQSFYYFYAWAQLGNPEVKPVISVPSGNFGNLTSGLMAKKMGLPVTGFVAATNINKVVPEYLETGVYTPRPSIQTIANAMDVGDPSNLARIRHMYDNNIHEIRRDVTGCSFEEQEIRNTIRKVYLNTGYMLDPHSAIGYLGLITKQKDEDTPGIFLATAHPAKFNDVVAEETGELPDIPKRLAKCMNREKQTIRMGNDYGELKDFLLQTKKEM